MAEFAPKEDNTNNNTLDSLRAAAQIGQQLQSTAVDHFQTIINFWHPFFQAQSIWQKAFGEGYEAMANKMRQETSKMRQS